MICDLAFSSGTFETHSENTKCLCTKATKNGFEFILAKGQFNQEELELWVDLRKGRSTSDAEKN